MIHHSFFNPFLADVLSSDISLLCGVNSKIPLQIEIPFSSGDCVHWCSMHYRTITDIMCSLDLSWQQSTAYDISWGLSPCESILLFLILWTFLNKTKKKKKKRKISCSLSSPGQEQKNPYCCPQLKRKIKRTPIFLSSNSKSLQHCWTLLSFRY